MDSTNNHSVEACYRLLALCARSESHSEMDTKLIQEVHSFTTWGDLPEQAELHGMGPLLWHHIRRLDLSIPPETKRILSGLYLRQRVFQQVQTQVLLEITSLLEQHQIHAVVLKGLAVAHEYYLDPVLRPSSDIDLLLGKEDIHSALSVLEKAGYKIPAGVDINFNSEWIVDSPAQNGFSVRIELHHSFDEEFIGFDSPLHELQIDRQMIHVPHFMDHLNYLIRHLTRHLFVSTSANPLPLKWMADIVSIVERHAQEIDWGKQAALLNRLEVIYSLTPLPERLSNVIPTKKIPIPHGVNQYPQGWPQYKQVEWRQVGPLNYLKKTFSSPSVWWLRLQYGIDKDSISWYGRLIYPLQILKMAVEKVIRR